MTKQKLNPQYSLNKDAMFVESAELQKVLGDKSAQVYIKIESALKGVFGYFLQENKTDVDCFELLAVDFVLDKASNVYMVEVNSCPNLAHCNDAHKLFVESLVKGV